MYRRNKPNAGKGKSKPLKWFNNILEEVADGNGDINSEKFKDVLRKPQVKERFVIYAILCWHWICNIRNEINTEIIIPC